MNIFALDYTPAACARAHCDKHVIKMILESTQMLSTVVRMTRPDLENHPEFDNLLYKATHPNHPCTIWVRESLANFNWLRDLTVELNREYMFRYNKSEPHKSMRVIRSLPIPKLPQRGKTAMAQAMPDEYKSTNPIEAYRAYYLGEKKSIATWTNREPPRWWTRALEKAA